MFTHHLKAHITDDARLDVRLRKYIWHMPNDAVIDKKFPALAAYIARIGAKRFNPRRFGVVEMVNHYPRQLCSIKLIGDGEIKVTGEKRKDYAPTKEERAAIEAERPGEKLPKSIKASRGVIPDLRKIVGRDALLFVCIDRAAKAVEGDVIMIEQRVEKEDGSKHFIPWTYQSDGRWEAMEPDGGLPFWKPLTPRGSDRIMIHEGPTTATFVDALVNDPAKLAAHPFGQILKRYEHWGMLGGAYRTADVMWSELRDANPSEVVYICDNDYGGQSALPQVSKWYGKALKGVMFDKDFRKGFDLADDMPKHLFAKTGKYVGPLWSDLLKFATWATKRVPNPEGKAGRPVMKVLPEFAQEWIHSVTPEVYIHCDWPFDILTEKEFNNKVRPYSDADDTARLLKADAASKTAILAYRPAKPPGIFAEDGKTYFNTHIAPPIAVVERGDYSPFIEFMEHLIPDKGDRLETMRWCGTLIVRGDIKMLYALLLISEAQGIGKGTLGEKILLPLVGKNNCSIPSESEIVDSNFNYWCAHKRLAIVHEIYAGHSAKAYNKLKSIVTDKYISVSKKFQANYEIENWIHIVACSNSNRALQLSMDDRRWLVPKLTEEKMPMAARRRFSTPAEYWVWFNAWLTEDEGLGKIKFWAREFLNDNAPVMTGAAAPSTEAKKKMIRDGYSQGMEIVASFLEGLKDLEIDDANREKKKPGRPIVLTSDVCRNLIKFKLYDGRHVPQLESPDTIRRVATAAGWFVSEERKTIVQGLPQAYLIASNPEWLGVTPAKLRKAREVGEVWFLEKSPTNLPM